MRRILGFSAVLAVASWAGTAATAHGYQTGTGAAGRSGRDVGATPAAAVQRPAQGAAAPAARPAPAPAATRTATASPTQTPAGNPTTTTSPGSLVTAPRNLEQQATERQAGATPATTSPARAVPGTAANPPAGTLTNPMAGTSAASSGTYAPATQPGTTTMAPGTIVPGTVNTQAYPSRVYSSYYVPGTQPARTPVTPMAGIPYYSSYYGPAGVQPGTVGTGYYTYPAGTTVYSARYVAPAYGTAAPTYMPVRRRGPFGGLFGRRNRPIYSVGPSTYGPAPYGYTYGTAPYTYTYVPTTTTYTYVPAPY